MKLTAVQYLISVQNGYIRICGNGEVEGAIVKDNKLKCGKCQKSYSNIDIIARHFELSTRSKSLGNI